MSEGIPDQVWGNYVLRHLDEARFLVGQFERARARTVLQATNRAKLGL